MMSSSIRNYRDSDESQVAAIVQAVWGKEAQDRFYRLNSWFQRRTTALAHSDISGVVLESHGEIVGYTRLLPCPYRVGEEWVWAAYFSDNVTHPQHRGKGIKMLKYLVSEIGNLRLGAPLARAGVLWDRLCKRSTKIKPITRCVLMLAPAVFLQKKHIPLPLGKVVDFIWQAKLRLAFKHYRVREERLTFSHEAALPSNEETDVLFAEFSRSFYAIAKKDNDYLRWRFIESPFEYQYLWLRDNGRLVGFTIYRPAVVRGRKTLLIIEIIAVGKQRNYAAMLEQICGYGLAEGYTDVQTLNSGCSIFWQVMSRLGAVLKVEKEYLMAYAETKQRYASEMYENKNWFISLAECDYEFVMFK